MKSLSLPLSVADKQVVEPARFVCWRVPRWRRGAPEETTKIFEIFPILVLTRECFGHGVPFFFGGSHIPFPGYSRDRGSRTCRGTGTRGQAARQLQLYFRDILRR